MKRHTRCFRYALMPLAIAATYGSAHADDKRIYIAPMGTYVLSDDDRLYDDDAYGGTLAIGTKLTESSEVELRGTFLDYEEGSFSAGGIGLNLHLFDNGGPYLHGDVTVGDATAYNIGLGLDLLGDSGFGLRLEALYHYEQSDDADDKRDYQEPLFNLGLRIPFGAKPEPPPPPPPPVQVVPPPPPPPPPVCSNGLDDDGDGAVDFPADKGCESPDDADEYNPICQAPVPGQPVTLEGCGVGDTIVLQGVTFEFDKSRLTPNAKTILDGVADALKARPDIKVEIGGHTDAKGSDEYNLKLSDRRAASVVTYLIGKGIPAERMTSKGYGEAMPVADNETDEGRELNRRVELKVLESADKVSVAPTVRTAENASSAPPEAGVVPGGAAAAEAAPAAAAPSTTAVTIENFAYVPATLTVPVGTTVTWTNKDGSNHFVTFPDQNSPRLPTDGVFTRTFDAPGSYDYFCTLHPDMKGTIVVQ